MVVANQDGKQRPAAGEYCRCRAFHRGGKRSHTVEHSCGGPPAFLPRSGYTREALTKSKAGSEKCLIEPPKRYGMSDAGRAEIRDEPLAEPGPGEVRIRALHSGISRGTESLVLAGRVPPSEFERMRAPFMGGSFPFPVKYGYATVGRVEAGPAELRGRLVFALHPHQSLFNVPAEAVVPIPDGVPPARAVLAANMETALNAHVGRTARGRPTALPWWARVLSARWSPCCAAGFPAHR